MTEKEWCIFNLDHWDYNFLLNKSSINKIKNWEKICSTIYHDSYYLKNKDDIQERMKKELIIWLLSSNEDQANQQEVIVTPYTKESKKVTIKISNNLLENLLKSEWDIYEYCYNSRGNKMDFFINESPKKDDLNEEITSLEERHLKK